MSNVLLIGEAMGLFAANNPGDLIDVEDFSFGIAGAEYNVALGLSRLGHNVTYITSLGKDYIGMKILKKISENNINTEFIEKSGMYYTGYMFKSLTNIGDPEICYCRRNSAAANMNLDCIDNIDFSKYDLIHITGILPALSEKTYKLTFKIIEKAKENKIKVSFDPNIRLDLWENKKMMIDTLNLIASKVDIFLPGIKEAKILSGKNNIDDILKYYLNNRKKICVIKYGSKGAYYSDGIYDGILVPGYKVDEVIDTVGAGDGFAVGMLSGIMEGLSIKDSCRRGNAIGAIQVMHRSDNEGLPDKNKLLKFMNGEC